MASISTGFEMKILVAGGAGFIGLNLVRHLRQLDHQVLVIDNLSTSPRFAPELLKKWGALFLQQDIEDPLPTDFVPEQIYGLASPASPAYFKSHNLQILSAGSIGLWNLLQFAQTCGARFLYASSSEVYGDPLEHPQRETYKGNVASYGPRSCYDEAKRFGEALCYAFQKLSHADIRVARIFNCYGPFMNLKDGRVLPSFLQEATHSKSLTIEGDGLQTRSFCYVDDMIEGLLRLMQSEFSAPLNLGNPKEITILDLAKKFEEAWGEKLSLKFVPYPEDGPRQRRPNIDRATKELGWVPQVDLDEGLERVIAYQKNNIHLIL